MCRRVTRGLNTIRFASCLDTLLLKLLLIYFVTLLTEISQSEGVVLPSQTVSSPLRRSPRRNTLVMGTVPLSQGAHIVATQTAKVDEAAKAPTTRGKKLQKAATAICPVNLDVTLGEGLVPRSEFMPSPAPLISSPIMSVIHSPRAPPIFPNLSTRQTRVQRLQKAARKTGN